MTRSSLAMDERSLRPLQRFSALKDRRKDLFWAWVAYQTIKGTATSALIWLPALAYWFGS